MKKEEAIKLLESGYLADEQGYFNRGQPINLGHISGALPDPEFDPRIDITKKLPWLKNKI